jgi:hypothetical protein
MSILDNEVWALRNGEVLTLATEEPTEGVWFAARVVPVPLPGLPVAPYGNQANTACEQCAVVTAAKNVLGEWEWLRVSPPSRRHLIDFLIDVGKVERDCWYYVVITVDTKQAAELARLDRQRHYPHPCIRCGRGEIADGVCPKCGLTIDALVPRQRGPNDDDPNQT